MTNTLPPRIPPQLTRANRAFWTSGRDGILKINHCTSCAKFVHPPVDRCPDCSTNLEPQAVSGNGKVFTFTINRHQYHPDVPPPYVIAIVELDEQPGIRFTTNIIDCDLDAVHIGMPVRVAFEPAGDEAWAPVFRPR